MQRARVAAVTLTQTQESGARRFMLRVFNYMAMGVAFTGIVAMVTASSEPFMAAVALGPFKWVLFAGLLGMGWFAPRLMMSRSLEIAHLCFWVYAALWGMLIAPFFFLYTQQSIAQVFFITAGAFGGMSLLGYTTSRNLSGLGGFFSMATIGILIAILMNAFIFQSSGMHIMLSIGVVVLFAALTAYETQMIKFKIFGVVVIYSQLLGLKIIIV